MTSAAGFVGSHVVDELASRDYDVRIIDDLCSVNFAHAKWLRIW